MIKRIPLAWKIAIIASIVVTIVIVILFIKKRKEAEEVGKLLDQYNQSSDLSHLLNGYAGNTSSGGGSTSSSSGTGGAVTTQGGVTLRDPRPLVDQIYDKLMGTNLMVYPEIVNKITNLTKDECIVASNYFHEEYGATTGESLYEFIDDEWDAGQYSPALEKLERYGLT